MKKSQMGLFLFLMFWGAFRLFPLPDQTIIYPDEWAYRALNDLSLEQRVVFFSGSPLTALRFKAMLEEIDEDALSPQGKALYDKLQEYLGSRGLLSFRAGSLGFDADLLPSGEIYARTNERLGYTYDNYYRRPFIGIPLSLSFSPYFTAHIDANFEQERSAALDFHNYTNLPTDNFSMSIPHRAYLSFGLPLPKSSGLQFRIGIGEDFIGRTHLGSIILSDRMKDLTYGAFSIYSPVIEYDVRIMQLDVNKYWYLHTLEGRFFKRVSISFVEGAMVNAPLELRFLNPLMVFHNFGAWSDYDEYQGEEEDGTWEENDHRVGSFFGMKLEVHLIPYTRIYGLWALNELQTPGEEQDEVHALRPDSFGFQAGFECTLPLSGASLTFGLEGVYTYPFMYVSRDKRWSFYKPSNGNSGPFQYWTGTPFGPDSIAASCWAEYREETWSVSGSFLFLVQGERSRFSIFNTKDYHPVLTKNYGDTLLSTPTGTPAYTYEIRLEGTWLPWKWLSLSLSPGYRVVLNHDNIRDRLEQGFELALSVRFIPRELWRLEMDWK